MVSYEFHHLWGLTATTLFIIFVASYTHKYISYIELYRERDRIRASLSFFSLLFLEALERFYSFTRIRNQAVVL
jgi:hypothetical protein